MHSAFGVDFMVSLRRNMAVIMSLVRRACPTIIVAAVPDGTMERAFFSASMAAAPVVFLCRVVLGLRRWQRGRSATETVTLEKGTSTQDTQGTNGTRDAASGLAVPQVGAGSKTPGACCNSASARAFDELENKQSASYTSSVSGGVVGDVRQRRQVKLLLLRGEAVSAGVASVKSRGRSPTFRKQAAAIRIGARTARGPSTRP